MKRTLFILSVFMLLLSFTSLHAQEKVVLSTFSEPDPFILTAINILREAYKRLDIEVEITHLPGERAINMANRGEVDGEVFRVAGIHEKYTNLLMVPVPVVETDTMAFTKGVTFAVNGWESLQPYTIGFVRGFKMAEDNTQGMNVEPVTTVRQNFLKLNDERIDVVIESRLGGLAMLKELKLTGVAPLEPPINSIQVYHYLHKKHQQLLPKITKVLQDMEQKGIVQKIRQEVIDELSSK